jgi:tetratricopeptide (TPR) repeat protein
LRYRTLQHLDLADKYFDMLIHILPDDARIENFLFDGAQSLNLTKEDIVRESDNIKNELDRVKYDMEQLGTQLSSPIAKANYLVARGCPGMAIDQLNEAAAFAAPGFNVAPMLARLYVRIGQPGDSEQGAEQQMLNIQGTGGMRPGEKEELWALIKLLQGDYDKARSFLEDAIAETRHSMAREALLNFTGDLRGGPTLNLAFSPTSTVEDVDRRARMEFHLAMVFLEAGEPNEAAKHFKQVLDIRNDTSFRPVIGFYLERILGEKLEPLPEPPKDEDAEKPATEPATTEPTAKPPADGSSAPAKAAEVPAKPADPPKD